MEDRHKLSHTHIHTQTLTAIQADNESAEEQHFVRVEELGEAHQAGAGDTQNVVQQQAALSAKRTREQT